MMNGIVRRVFNLFLVSLMLATAILFSACSCNGDSGNNDDPKTNNNLIVSKSEYASGEEIVLTAIGDDDDWVGVYREKDDVNTLDPIARYPVHNSGYLSGLSYVVQRSATFSESRKALKNFPAVKYKAVLFGSAGTSEVVSVKNFSVNSKSLTLPSAPTSLVYDQANPNSGLADGVLTVTFDENNFNATELLLFWADENGELQNWTSLAKTKISSNPFKYEFVKGTIIPSEATAIRAYSVNKSGTSESFCELKLNENSGYDLSGTTLTSFQVVSDVHVAVKDQHLASPDAKELHANHLRAMAEDVVATCPNSDALIVVGDVANSGQESEWKKNAEILSSVSGLPSVYYSVGNHDLYNGSYSTQIGYFKKYANVESVYYEKEIGGFHHIFLGSESNDKSGVDADLTETQLNWFESRLESITKQDANKQIFVHLHQSLYNTVAGSFKGQGWNGVMQDGRLRTILKKYPQVYMFNGHSHWELNSYGNMHRADGELPNIFNTASVGYLWSSYDNPTGEYLKGSQGYFVMVYQDKTVVLGRDFENGKYIPSACYETKIYNAL